MGSTRAENNPTLVPHTMLVAGTCTVAHRCLWKIPVTAFLQDQTAKMHVNLISDPVLFIQNPFLLRLLVVSLC